MFVLGGGGGGGHAGGGGKPMPKEVVKNDGNASTYIFSGQSLPGLGSFSVHAHRDLRLAVELSEILTGI